MTRRRDAVVGAVTLLVLLGAWAITLRPASLGGPTTFIVIRGDSMEPTYETGDLVVLVADASYGVGDPVGYRVPAGELGAGMVVVHRIIGGSGQEGFTLLGDGNAAPDPWTPVAGDVVGRVQFRVPLVGRAIAALRQPAMLGALATALVVTFLFVSPASRPAPREKRAQSRRAVLSGWHARH